jgi:cytochrome oxidase Cu insertion factor (SCO1/SenC/PrrC family)
LLVDLDGHFVTNESFKGKWLLLYFGFAHCPDICPSEMLKIARVIDQLKVTHPQIAAKIVPVFVLVDPARDSLSALKAYSEDFHPDFVFLMGSPEQVQQMAKKYRVYVSKAEETEDGITWPIIPLSFTFMTRKENCRIALHNACDPKISWRNYRTNDGGPLCSINNINYLLLLSS